MKKRYTLTYDYTDVVVEIDHAVCTDALLHEINDFWSDRKFRLSQANGDITRAVLLMLAQTVLRLNVSDWRDTVSLMKDTETCPEGWPLLDGSAGITLVKVEDFVFDADEFTVEEEEL
jgi:hypothetical protein